LTRTSAIRARWLATFLMMTACGSCATTAHQASTNQNDQATAVNQPACISQCGAGYQCSSIVVQGIKTGLCIAQPTQCVSDADCLNSAVVPGTVPLHYACDKHSGGLPDKTGSAVVADHGTCMPTVETGMDR
jgi:hypothetical protein